jgi:hypothetical protein
MTLGKEASALFGRNREQADHGEPCFSILFGHGIEAAHPIHDEHSLRPQDLIAPA